MGKLGSIVGALLVGGLLIALLREFNWDPFALVEWFAMSLWELLNWIGDGFSSNPTFQEAVEAPE